MWAFQITIELKIKEMIQEMFAFSTNKRINLHEIAIAELKCQHHT